MFDVVPFTHPKSRVDLALARLWATRTDQAAVHATGIARTHRRVGDVHAQFTAITATDLSADQVLTATDVADDGVFGDVDGRVWEGPACWWQAGPWSAQ